ncbi:MAG TPA: SRPBCC domain-containing protein [Phycisphaerae bacterium]|nr:SRPBCC domain-containing protein [Phycisphaerae bacterium]HRW53528.1 SRPBCC domain-containing protein [Phycisphaerae bacterium]
MGSINIKVEYPHPPRKVWFALTDSDAIAAWLMENNFKPEVGHEFTLRTDPAPGFDGVVHCKVIELVEEKRLSFSWRGGPLDTIATFELRPTAVGTELTFTQTGFSGFKSNLTRLILRSGSKKIYHRLLPALLDRIDADGALRGESSPEACDMRGFWRVLVGLFAPLLGKRPEERND